MIENRPIVAITIGYVLGIIVGLYCKISVVFFYLVFLGIYLINIKPKKREFKLISFRRYFRYFKIVFTKKVILIILLSSIISNTILLKQNKRYESLYFGIEDVKVVATVISNVKEKDFKNVYKIKVEDVNGNHKFKNTYLYLNVKKNVRIFKYGEKIKISGIFEEPSKKRNYKGFNYKEYLKTLNIYGTINSKNLEKIEDAKNNIFKISNDIFLAIKKNIHKNFDKKTSNIIMGITFGYTEEIDEETKLDFSESNLSHILAVSGVHISFITFFINLLFRKVLGKKYSRIVTSVFLFSYMFLTGFSPSIVRAGLMTEIYLWSYILYRKNDLWQNLSLSLLAILMYNPFLIESTGVLLTFFGTIGIAIKPRNLDKVKKSIRNIIKNTIQVTTFVTIFISPILAVYFNKVPISSLLISVISEVFVGPIIFLSFIEIFILFIVPYTNLNNITGLICKLTNGLINIAELGRKMPLNKVYVVTPSIVQIIIYYFILLSGLFLYYIYRIKNLSPFQKRIKNLVSLFKYRFYQNKRKVISSFLVLFMVLSIFKIIPKDLNIYFIDVGQGDSCLIVTPQNKSILIDGGGSSSRRL